MLTPIQRSRSLTQDAYQQIKEAIIANELPPGRQLKEEELSAQLGISSTPLREALAKLEQEWLVKTIPYQGKFVTDITPQNVRDIYEVRCELEGLAVELATPVLAQRDLEELERLFRMAEAQITQDSSDLSFYFASDSRLHDLIMQNAGNDWLIRLLRALNDHIQRIRAYSAAKSEAHMHHSFHEHLAILEAIKLRDAARAKTLMERHVKRAGERIAQLLAGRQWQPQEEFALLGENDGHQTD